jgi:hypothetical protein
MKHIFPSFHLEGVVVGAPIMYNTAVKLPRTSKEDMAHGHRNNITLKCVFIGSYLE